MLLEISRVKDFQDWKGLQLGSSRATLGSYIYIYMAAGNPSFSNVLFRPVVPADGVNSPFNLFYQLKILCFKKGKHPWTAFH
jgi:hypothetical protein